MNLTVIVTLITELSVLIAVIFPVIKSIAKISDGTRCQLRSEMLRIYYNHKDDDRIRQYELENFIFLYNAYKALNGNSFIDKIYKEVLEWEVLS